MDVVGWNAHSIIIETDNREYCFPLTFAFLSTLFKMREKGYVYIVNYGCSMLTEVKSVK